MRKSKGKNKGMDKTSAAYADHLDQQRERNKKRHQAQAQRDKTSLSRGGFRH